MTQPYSNFQRSGSEYGGVPETPAGIQPKPHDALNNTELLRLGYMTGVEEWNSIEDLRQFHGLRPANGTRPNWLSHVSTTDDPRLDSRASAEIINYPEVNGGA